MEIKPCPICGEEGVLVKVAFSLYFVKARCTHINGPTGDTEDEAISAWNRVVVKSHTCKPAGMPFFQRVESVMTEKSACYASADDPLANFKRNAERLGIRPFLVWAIYFSKHADAIIEAIKKNPDCPLDESEGFESRLIDAAAYLSLAEKLYREVKR